MLEHIVFKSVMDHLDEHHILKHYQHGFMKAHSCETQLINTIEDLGKELDEQDQVAVLILDFAKAFDTCDIKECWVNSNTMEFVEKLFTG